MRQAVLLLSALCCLFQADYSPAAAGGTMTNILNLNQKEFFSADQSFLTQRESQLLDMDFYGVAVNAPRRILTDRHAKLPLVIAVQYCGKRGWDVPLKNNGLLVGMNLRDGSVYFADIYQNKKRLANKWRAGKTHRGAYPPGLSLKAAVLKIVDVRQRLNLKWDTGIWAFGVLYYDWPSNTVIVKLQGREKAAPSPVIRVHPEPDPRDAAVLPTYLPTVNTPKALKSELKFTVQFKDEKDGQQLKVYGSFAVPVRDFNLPAHKRVRQFHDKKQQNIAAVIPITLVVLRLDQDEPLQFNWAVPVYGKPLKAGMQARGSFSIDALNTGAETKLGCGRYACYIFMDGRIFGPKIIDISTIKSVERPAVVPRPH